MDIQVTDSHIDITGFNNIRSGGCNNNMDMSDGYDPHSLKGESTNHLSNIVLNYANNNYNHFYFSFFIYFQINMWNLSVYLNNIKNLINLSSKNVIQFFNDICPIIKLINIKCNIGRVFCLKTLLNQIKCKLIQLHSELICLCTFYSSFNLLKCEWDRIIKSLKHIPNINEKLSELKDKFKCSLSQFTKIENKIKSARTIICQLNELKQKSCKILEKLLLHICIYIGSNSITIDLLFLNRINEKIQCLDKNIDTLSSDITIIESHTNSLKLSLCNIINLQIPRNSSIKIQYIHSIFNVDIDEIFSLIKFLYCWICNISEICNSESDPKCNCTCKCNSQCTEYTICLCSCNDAKTEASGCCICMCKKKENPKCICICLCKKGQGCGTEHQCNQSIVKVDIGTLKDQIKKVSQYLSWIRCQLSLNFYKSIISWIHWIELLFKEVGTRISELRTLKDILSLLTSICTKCEQCSEGCSKDINSLVENIQKALKYYSLFRTRIKDIGSFVEHKINYSRSKDIISSLEKSVNPLSKQLKLINRKILKNSDYTKTSNKLLMSVYSNYSVKQCYLLLSNLSKYSSKLSIALYINQIVENCRCVNYFNSNGTKFQTTYFHKYLIRGSNNIHKLKKLFIANDGNHFCMCLVIKYVLYPNLIKSMYRMTQIYCESISNINREFLTFNYSGVQINEVTKMLFIIMNLIYKISMFMERRYLWTTTEVKVIKNLVCLCRAPDDPLYPYLISIILFLSSIVQNIWTMDPQSIGMSIQSLSSLLSEYQSIHIYTHYYSHSGYTIYSLTVKKECQSKAAKKCCCCWCVTCYNLVIMCVSLCIQCKFCNAICADKKKVCEKVKSFCTIDDCECTCAQKDNGLCCLLKLATCAQGSNDCKTLKELLEKCCKACNGKDGCCCAKLKEKVKNGLCKVLILGCDCECTSTSSGAGEQVKVKCLLFNYPDGCTSVAVLVFCKCPQPPTNACCCLTTLIEKLKSELREKICQDGQCVCEQLKTICTENCTGQCPAGCSCPELKKSFESICNGDNCLCKEIEKLKECCGTDKNCKCKGKEGCCRCVCCKLVPMSIRLLVRACTQNVMHPYHRITLELISSSKNKKRRMRTILVNINKSMVKKTYLIKNTFNSLDGGNNIGLNPIISGRNWGYDTRYEHEIICNNSSSDV